LVLLGLAHFVANWRWLALTRFVTTYGTKARVKCSGEPVLCLSGARPRNSEAYLSSPVAMNWVGAVLLLSAVIVSSMRTSVCEFSLHIMALRGQKR
jgi:hypothetical protein